MFLTEDVTDAILAPVCQEASVQTWVKQLDTFLNLLVFSAITLFASSNTLLISSFQFQGFNDFSRCLIGATAGEMA